MNLKLKDFKFVLCAFLSFSLLLIYIPLNVKAGELDGKALLCKEDRAGINRDYGLIFGEDKVSKWIVVGYGKNNNIPFPIN